MWSQVGDFPGLFSLLQNGINNLSLTDLLRTFDKIKRCLNLLGGHLSRSFHHAPGLRSFSKPTSPFLLEARKPEAAGE